MIEVLLAVGLVQLWLLWRIHRALGLRARPRIVRTSKQRLRYRDDFQGAIPPSRYVVVRWPDGLHFYSGCGGAAARRMYEHTHPAPGEEVELWELGTCRGHK